jgi:competence protein ComEA
MTLLHSLVFKLCLLALVAAFVLWFGWPVDNDASPDSALPRAVAPVAPNNVPLVPVSREEQPRPTPARHNAKIDLNRATPEQLLALPGIGETLAKRMVSRRAMIGGFQTVDDLLTVKGIGHKRLEQLRPLLTVGPVQKQSRQQPVSPAVPEDRL